MAGTSVKLYWKLLNLTDTFSGGDNYLSENYVNSTVVTTREVSFLKECLLISKVNLYGNLENEFV